MLRIFRWAIWNNYRIFVWIIPKNFSRSFQQHSHPRAKLSAVSYKSRGLEALEQKHDVDLRTSSSRQILLQRPSPIEKSRVDGVIEEWSDLMLAWAVSKWQHLRCILGCSARACTSAHFRCSTGSGQNVCGAVCLVGHESLHCTLRSLALESDWWMMKQYRVLTITRAR